MNIVVCQDRDDDDLYRNSYENTPVHTYFDTDELLLVLNPSSPGHDPIEILLNLLSRPLGDVLPDTTLCLRPPITFPTDEGKQLSIVACEITPKTGRAQEVLKEINDAVPVKTPPDNDSGWQGASLNLLVGSAGNAIIKGGPGSQAATAGTPGPDQAAFYMKQSDAVTLMFDGDGSDVLIAILDAFPNISVSPSGPAANVPLLQSMLAMVEQPAAGTLIKSLGPHKPVVNHLLEAHADHVPAMIKIVDHGIFIAGIVHSIAPGARLCLVRVLNEYGVGDLTSLIAGIKYVTHLAHSTNRKLVINCSLVVARPEDGALYSPGILKEVAELLTVTGNEPSETVCIVGAAGNDREAAPAGLKEADYPAQLPTVIGVAALDRGAAAALYSNKADTDPVASGLKISGIATFGGADSTPDNGLLGLYTSPQYPDNTPNNSGWAYWAGTSFAAPIISALIARGLSDGQWAMSDVLHKLRITADPPSGLDTLVGDALQIWQGQTPPVPSGTAIARLGSLP